MPIDLSSVQQDPRYAQMTYDEQLSINQLAAQKILSQDPRWAQLQPFERADLIAKASASAPVFENPDQNDLELIQLADAIQQDPDNRELQNRGMFAIGGDAFRKQLTMFDVIEKVTGKIGEFLDLEPNEREQLTKAQDSRDRQKALQYLELSMAQDERAAKLATVGKVAGNIGGFITDFAAWWGATAPIAGGVKALAQASRLGKAYGLGYQSWQGIGTAIKSSKQRYIWQRLIPEVAVNARGGVIGVLRENMLGTLDEKIQEDPSVWNMVWQNSKVFGEYFIGDMLFFGALDAGRIMGKVGRGVFTKAWAGEKITDAVDNKAFGEILDSLLGSGNIPRSELRKLSKEQQEHFTRVQSYFNLAQNVETLDPRSPEFAKLFTYRMGFDVYETGGKWKVHDILDERTIDVKDFNDGIGLAFELADQKFDVDLSSAAIQKGIIGSADNLQLNQMVTARTDGLNLDPNALSSMLNPTEAGIIRGNNAKYVAKEILYRSGVDMKDFNKIEFRYVDDFYQKSDFSNPNIIELPRAANTPQEQEKYLRTFLDQLDTSSQAFGGNETRGLTRQFLDRSRNDGYSPLWVDNMATKIGGRLERINDGYRLTVNGNVIREGSLRDVGSYLFVNHAFTESTDTAFQYTKNALAQEHGLILEKVGDEGVKVISRKGKQTAANDYRNLEELFNKHPEFRPKLPVSSMPDVTIVDNNLQRFAIERNVAAGPIGQVSDFINQFADYPTSKSIVTMKFGDNVIEFNKPKRKFKVTHPEYNLTREFSSLEKAKNFLSESASTFENIRDAAAFKGARIAPYKGNYLIYRKGISNPTIANSLDDAKRIIKEMDRPTYAAKELTDLDNMAISELERQFRDFLPDDAFEATREEIVIALEKLGREGRDVSARTSLFDLALPTDMSMKNIANEIGDQNYHKHFRNMEEARRLVDGSMSTFRKQWRQAVGKVDDNEFRRMGNIFLSEIPENQWAGKYLELYGQQIPAKTLQAMTRVRDMLGRTPEASLSAVFGIDSWKFLHEYFPRLRNKLRGMKNLDSSAEQAIKSALGFESLPKEIKFFANNLRTDELLHFVALENLEDVMMTYVQKGYKNILMDQPYREAVEYAKNAGLNGIARNRMTSYLEQVRGLASTYNQKNLENATYKISREIVNRMQKMGLDVPDSRVTDDMISFFNSLTILSTMSFRAWLPIRNSFQPFLTLGPRIGNDVLSEAINRAARNGAEIVPRLKARGIIPDRHPLMEMASASKFQKFNNAGMRAYQTSDAWTRAVVDQAVDITMTDAAKRFMAGNINEKEFIDLSKIKIMDKNDQLDILNHLRAGDLDAAKDVFTIRLINETMFPYKPGTNPSAFNGVMGRLFGGFGHYPVYFTANVARGLKNVSGVEKLAYAGRLVGNSLALYGAFNYLLGIDAKNFLFTSPMSFAGGPYYNLLNTALQSTDTTSYRGAEARAELGRQIPQLFVPGSLMLRHVNKGIEALQNNDIHNFLIHAITAPENENF